MTTPEKLSITKYDLLFESRLTKNETITEILAKDIKEIKLDLRWIIMLMLTLLGVMAKGFHWI